MITKQEIEKLNENLKRGDAKAIATQTGLSIATVSRFLNGKQDSVSDETEALIIENAVKIIKQRGKLKIASEKLIKSISI